MNVLNLPDEIHELILQGLEIQSLTCAMKCCYSWYRIGQKMLKRWCLSHISKEIFTEINDGKDSFNSNDDHDWLSFILIWSRFPVVNKTTSPITVLSKAGDMKNKDSISVVMSGNFILLAQHSRVYIIEHNSTDIKRFVTTPHSCIDLKLLKVTSSSRNFIVDDQFQNKKMSHDAIVTISCQSLCVQTISTGQVLFHTALQDSSSAALSTRANQFAFYSKDTVNVCEVELLNISLEGMWVVDVSTICEFKSRPVRVLQLWEDRVICIANSGCLSIHSISTSTIIYTCNQTTNVLRYPLTTCVHRGIIFCDLKMMKIMLNYWHVNMGSPEWAVWHEKVGWEKLSSKISTDEEITTFALKRTVIAAGTSKGKVLFYRHANRKERVVQAIERGPCFNIEVSPGQQISHLDFSFTSDILVLCVRTKQNALLTLTLPTIEKFN